MFVSILWSSTAICKIYVTYTHTQFVKACMTYSYLDRQWDRNFFFVILGQFLPFYIPLKTWKIKILKKNKKSTWVCHYFKLKFQNFEKMKNSRIHYPFTNAYHKWRSDIRCTNRTFLSFWVIVCNFTLWQSEKKELLKKWKIYQEILSFCTCEPKVTIIMMQVPKIWTDKCFCHFGRFAISLPNNT